MEKITEKKTFLEVFEEVLTAHSLNWCKGCDSGRGHKRGFVLFKDRTTVHLDRKISTRSTLHRALHEIGHCVNDEKGLKSWQCEEGAERFANETMKQYGIRIPRKVRKAGSNYVKRKKRHGDNIRAGRLNK